MRPGDVLLEIDGRRVAPAEGASTIHLASQLLAGPAGSEVVILGRHVRKGSKAPPQPYQITLTRGVAASHGGQARGRGAPDAATTAVSAAGPTARPGGPRAEHQCAPPLSPAHKRRWQEDSMPSLPHTPLAVPPGGAGSECPESPAPETHKGFQNRIGRRRGGGGGRGGDAGGDAVPGEAGNACACGQGELCKCRLRACVCEHTGTPQLGDDHPDLLLEALLARTRETRGVASQRRGEGEVGLGVECSPEEGRVSDREPMREGCSDCSEPVSERSPQATDSSRDPDESMSPRELAAWGQVLGCSDDMMHVAAPGEWEAFFRVYASDKSAGLAPGKDAKDTGTVPGHLSSQGAARGEEAAEACAPGGVPGVCSACGRRRKGVFQVCLSFFFQVCTHCASLQ